MGNATGWGARMLTVRFAALASHYLLEACFCRPARATIRAASSRAAKAARQQALVPIPSGATLATINAALLAQMDARLDTQRDAAGQTIGHRFAEEQRLFRLAPIPFAPEATTFATVTPRALVRLEGAVYSVPTRWAGLDLVVRIGATTVTIIGRDGTAIARAQTIWTALDRLPALSRRARAQAAGSAPGAARFAARSRPSVSGNLGSAPAPAWTAGSARLFANVLGHLEPYGPAVVIHALSTALATGTPLLLALSRRGPRSHRGGGDACGPARDRGRQWVGRRLRRLARRSVRMSATLIRELVVAQTPALKLPGVPRTFERLARQAHDAHWPHEDYLHEGLSAEQASRHESVIRQRLHDARFPEIKTLDTSDLSAVDGVSATQLHTLARGECVTAPENLIFAGPTGTGKTQLAIALGVEATKQKRRVLFTRAADLVRQLLEARDGRELTRLQQRLLRVNVLIVDTARSPRPSCNGDDDERQELSHDASGVRVRSRPSCRPSFPVRTSSCLSTTSGRSSARIPVRPSRRRRAAPVSMSTTTSAAVDPSPPAPAPSSAMYTAPCRSSMTKSFGSECGVSTDDGSRRTRTSACEPTRAATCGCSTWARVSTVRRPRALRRRGHGLNLHLEPRLAVGHLEHLAVGHDRDLAELLE